MKTLILFLALAVCSFAADETKLLTAEDVKAEWLKNANPANVSSLYQDGEKQIVAKVANGARKSSFKGEAKPTDAQKLRQQLAAYQAEILAGKHDLRAMIAALENNQAVFASTGDSASAAECAAQIARLKKPK